MDLHEIFGRGFYLFRDDNEAYLEPMSYQYRNQMIEVEVWDNQ